eukprot:8720541-Pyramimonas_sp.AAC.2
MTVPLYHCTTALQALSQEQAERLARAQAELAGARAELANQRAALVAEHAERGRKVETLSSAQQNANERRRLWQ